MPTAFSWCSGSLWCKIIMVLIIYDKRVLGFQIALSSYWRGLCLGWLICIHNLQGIWLVLQVRMQQQTSFRLITRINTATLREVSYIRTAMQADGASSQRSGMWKAFQILKSLFLCCLSWRHFYYAFYASLYVFLVTFDRWVHMAWTNAKYSRLHPSF